MSQADDDLAFRKRADAYIGLANQQIDQAEIDTVNASLIYAGARFSAFIVASGSENAEEMQKHRAQAIAHFTDTFNKMLTENLDEHIANFERYMALSD